MTLLRKPMGEQIILSSKVQLSHEQDLYFSLDECKQRLNNNDKACTFHLVTFTTHVHSLLK